MNVYVDNFESEQFYVFDKSSCHPSLIFFFFWNEIMVVKIFFLSYLRYKTALKLKLSYSESISPGERDAFLGPWRLRAPLQSFGGGGRVSGGSHTHTHTHTFHFSQFTLRARTQTQCCTQLDFFGGNFLHLN